MLVADNDGCHWPATVTGDVALQKGFHSIRLNYFQKGGDKALSLAVVGPGIGKNADITSLLFHTVEY